MGGEGAMMAMITSLKNNSRRKNRTQFDKGKAGGYGDGQKVEFDFPEVTPEVLKDIRNRLTEEKKRTFQKRIILFLIAASIIIALLIYL
ncbi:hypothetical protein M0G43_06430 [Subsaxibacter sp. CAU 1640]|uniref:hypothetical protein n=1 Tax=Subsaxibacter sp. CAU 1640 TaxID=2933271 RepID=UPI002005935D|nr:hypothetical protein [Subsaxibacter sp. CAU 1640]MCK7590201.1 hypothetical protein [Subsaxibacter sp. CAU 1640]